MDVVSNFFTLRPTFTFFGLKVVWYLYLLNTLVQAYTNLSGISRILEQRGISFEAWLPNAIPFSLGIIAQLLLVRLLLEVAAIIMSTRTSNRDL